MWIGDGQRLQGLRGRIEILYGAGKGKVSLYEFAWFVFNNEDERAKRLAEYQPMKMVISEITED